MIAVSRAVRAPLASTSTQAVLLQDGSSNVDDSGNFSIEVIRSALERFDLQLSASDMDSVVQNAHSYDAFILNLEQHWFTIRRIAGRFWNLDSTKKQPQAVSEFFLSAFLSQMRQEGYSIFVVQGALPKDQAGNAPLQNLFSIDAILRGDKDAHFSGGSPAPEGDEVQQLASAVAADPTLHEAAVQSIMERRQLPRAEAEMMLVMAISSVPPLVPAAAPAPAASSGADGDDDDQLAQAIALSLS